MDEKPTYKELERRIQQFQKSESELKMTEKNLREREERYRSLIDSSPLPFLITQEEKIVFVNPAVLGLFGVKNENEIIGTSPKAWIHPDFMEWAFQRRCQALEKNEALEPVELTLVRKDGHEISVLANTVCIRHTGMPAILSMFQDITERKMADENLRKSEARHVKMLANIGDVIVIIDQEGINRYKSPNIEKIFGWKPEEVVGASTWDNVHPDDIEFTQQFFEKIMHTPDAVGTMECRYRCKDGSYKWIEFSGSNLFHDPDIQGLLGNYQDITERKQAEEALIKKEALFRGLFNHMTSGSAVYEVRNDGSRGADYIIREFNWKSLEMEGKKLGEVLGKSLFDLRPNIDDYGLIPVMKKVWETGSPECFPVTIYQDDNFSNYYENHIFKLPSGEVVTIYNDVTDQKNQEKALQENEKKYRVLFDTFPLGITVSDQFGNIVESNAVSEKLLGLSQNEHQSRAIDEPSWRIIRPDGTPMPAAEYASVRALKEKRQIENIEMGIVKADAQITWINVSAAPLHLDKYGVVVTYGDITARKKAEQEYKTLFREMLDGFALHEIICDDSGTPVDYRFLDINPAFEKMTGLKAESVLGRTVMDVLPGTEVSWIETYGTVALSGDPITFENYSAEIEKHFEITAFCPAPGQFACIFQDITERKRMENENLVLANIIRHSQDFIGVADMDQNAFFVNPAGQVMVGLEGDEAVKRTSITDYYFDEDLPFIKKTILPTLFSKGRWNGEFHLRHFKTGEPIPILYDLFLTENPTTGRPTNITTISRNIAELKQVEEKLKHSERTYREIFNSITDALFIHDIDTGSILDVNDSMLYKFGYKREELLGLTVENLSALLEPYTNKKAGELIKRAGRGETVVFEWLNRKKNGELFYSENILKFVEIAGAERIIAIVRDITERKQAEAERERLQTQLNQAQKMESVGRLAGGVAHDFNNMLGVILGHTEFALEKAEPGHELHADLKEIQTAAKRSANLTKQLLTFARKDIIAPKQLDLNDTVESMLNMLWRLIGEDIDLVWQPATHLWLVKMDPSQIDQILANLCVNARDAISGVGKLTIETGRKTFDEDYCSEHQGFIPGDFVLLAVSDNGCGMDKDTLDNLFEPFFTTKEVGKGTGLGLATIFGIVKQNNGFINVYSEPGQGSTFKIYLPRLVAEEDTDTAVPEKKAAAGGSETILLVEDEPSILRMTRMMLEKKGYSVLSAATPAEAIEKAKNYSDVIDLLMTDVVMPEMNGRDMAGQITDLYPDILLLFMSGYTANVIAHQGVLDEGVAFIQKPFSMADLAEKIREVLDMASDKS